MSIQKKILIVDDEPNILLSLDFLMRKKGYEVYVARSGTEALDIILTKNPDLVILDIMMPDVDGYHICEYIKTSEERKHIKVIFLSAKSKESDIKYGMQLGADDYVTKPFSTRALVDRVAELTNQ